MFNYLVKYGFNTRIVNVDSTEIMCLIYKTTYD